MSDLPRDGARPEHAGAPTGPSSGTNPPHRPPSYDGRGLVNLVASIERALTGSAPSTGLTEDADALPADAAGYVLFLLDGLGASQVDALDHDDPLRRDLAATLDAGFPTTTTTNLATIATGLTPREHGIVAHLLWLEELGTVVNTLKWTDKGGDRVDLDTSALLPSPNLWERLRDGGIEPIVVQPGAYVDSPLSAMLYRGARFEPIWDVAELVDATTGLAGPGRLVMAYLPHVDLAAHVHGRASTEHAEAMTLASLTWDRIAARLPAGVALLGTADHGHRDYTAEAKVEVATSRFPELIVYGDPRGLLVRGPAEAIDRFAEGLPATLHRRPEIDGWWGPDPGPGDRRLPDAVLLADDDHLLLPGFMDRRLVGYHGGLHPEEVAVPLLVSGP